MRCGRAVPSTPAPTRKPKAFPRSLRYHPEAIFMPIGYMPARKNPVAKRVNIRGISPLHK
jgi:hypothetical protein